MKKDMSAQNLSPEIICTHLADEYQHYLGAAVPPVFQTSIHLFPDLESMKGPARDKSGSYIYGRVANPTVVILEQKLAALENGKKALCFGSGMAAITSVIMNSVKTGEHVICLRNAYGPARNFIQNYLSKYGISSTMVKGTDIDELLEAIKPNTRLIYLESPTSVNFMLQDLRAIAGLAKKHNIRTAIDNSWATPVFQKPLDLGIDIVIHTMSKYIGGHSDIIGGAVISSEEIIKSIALNERELLGGILHPMEGWLTLRGLRTLPGRMRHHQESAMKIANYLEKHPKIKKVFYPGLPSHPQYELGKQQMSGYSGLMSFALDCKEDDMVKFINALKLFKIGVSWGGFESLVVASSLKMTQEMREYYGLPESLVRISVGLEDCDSLLEDIDQALTLLGR